MYIQYIKGLFQSSLSTAHYALVTSSLHYNDSLDTWTVIHMTAAKFKPLIFSAFNYTLLLSLYTYAVVHNYVFTSLCSVTAFRLLMVDVPVLWFPELSPCLSNIHSRLTHCLQIANSATLIYWAICCNCTKLLLALAYKTSTRTTNKTPFIIAAARD
jgi:hypothetical protein